MTAGPWEPALDALEAWVRRTAEGVLLHEPPPDAPALPGDALPVDLQLRAQLLVARMQELQAEVLRRREQLTRERAYGAA
jgi:hypothetical protein